MSISIVSTFFKKLAIFLCCLTFIAFKVFASSTFVPSDASNRAGYSSAALGDTCYALAESDFQLPCNPAYIALDRKRKISISILGSGDLQHLRDVNDLVSGDARRDTVERVFERHRNYEAQTNIDINFSTSNFGLNLTPVRFYLYDETINPPLPKITLLAVREQQAQMQMASFVNSEWAVGLQARLTRREYIFNQFFLTELWAEGGNSLLERQIANAIYLEPGVLYSPENMDWNPQFGATLADIGFIDDKNENTPFTLKPNLHLSTSVSNSQVRNGVQLGLDLHLNEDSINAVSGLRFGLLYRYEFFNPSLSFSQNDYSLGLAWRYSFMNSGISWSANRLNPALSLASVYYQFFAWWD